QLQAQEHAERDGGAHGEDDAADDPAGGGGAHADAVEDAGAHDRALDAGDAGGELVELAAQLAAAGGDERGGLAQLVAAAGGDGGLRDLDVPAAEAGAELAHLGAPRGGV